MDVADLTNELSRRWPLAVEVAVFDAVGGGRFARKGCRVESQLLARAP